MAMEMMPSLFGSMFTIANDTTASLESEGTTLRVGVNSFFIPAAASGSLPNSCDLTAIPHEMFIAATVFSAKQNQTFDSHEIESLVASYLEGEDVFNEAFLSGEIIPWHNQILLYLA